MRNLSDLSENQTFFIYHSHIPGNSININSVKLLWALSLPLRLLVVEITKLMYR